MTDKLELFIEETNLKCESSIGILEFRHITVKDMEFFIELNKDFSDKEYSIKAIFNQLETSISIEDFSKLPETELEKIIEQYAKKSIYEYYSKTNSSNVFLKFKKSILAYLEEFKSINKQFEPMKKIIAQSATDFSNLYKILNDLNNSFIKVLEQFKSLQSFAVQYKKVSKKSLKNLKKYSWFINSSMPIKFIAKTAKATNSNEMKKLFISYHLYDNCKILDNYYTKWSKKSLFKKRLKILRDTITLFKNNYKNKKININNILIPVLINQIEGIKHDFIKSKGFSNNNSELNYIDTNTKQNISWRIIFKDTLKNENDFTKLIGEIFIKILFQNENDKAPIINFSRHKISHGAIIKYGTLETVVRCFMILEFLSDLEQETPPSNISRSE